MWYWSVAILFWQLSIDHIVNGQCKRCGFARTRLRHPSLPFDILPYSTRTICRRVRTYVRLVSHVTTKRKEVDHILWVWGSVPRALRARGSPAISTTKVSWTIRFSNRATLHNQQSWSKRLGRLFTLRHFFIPLPPLSRTVLGVTGEKLLKFFFKCMNFNFVQGGGRGRARNLLGIAVLMYYM